MIRGVRGLTICAILMVASCGKTAEMASAAALNCPSGDSVAAPHLDLDDPPGLPGSPDAALATWQLRFAPGLDLISLRQSELDSSSATYIYAESDRTLARIHVKVVEDSWAVVEWRYCSSLLTKMKGSGA